MYEKLKFNKKLIEIPGSNKEMGFASISKGNYLNKLTFIKTIGI